jgi:hypothetical protein
MTTAPPATPLFSERFERAMAVFRLGGLFGGPLRPADASLAFRPRTGDVVLRLLASSDSIGLASASLSGYSHCGVLHDLGDRVFVDDCYPPCVGHHGGPRRTPWSVWSAREGHDQVVHWLALRHQGLDPVRASLTLERLVASDIRFTLTADMAAPTSGDIRETANCSAFVRTFLEQEGVDCRPSFGTMEISRRVLTRFFGLIEAGLYDAIPFNTGRSFYEHARLHGLTRIEDWPRASLPAAFCEVLPVFSPVAYGQNPQLPRRLRRYGPYLYRRLVPLLQAARASQGLPPDQLLPLLPRHGGPSLRRLLRVQPAGEPVCGASLAIRLLLDLADRPHPYLTIPQSAFLALNGQGMVGETLLGAALLLTPALVGAARIAGWKPLRVFDASAP